MKQKKSFNFKFSIFISLISLIFSIFNLVSCADADGLHNQSALLVTFEFTGFGETEGTFAIPGNFDNWDNTTSDITLKKGEGTSVQMPITVSNIQFSLVPVNAWNRPWYVKGTLEGNGSDAGEMRNFYIDGLDLNAGEITLVIDGSSGTATPVVK